MAASVRDEVIRFAFRAARGREEPLLAVDESGRILASNGAASSRIGLTSGRLCPTFAARWRSWWREAADGARSPARPRLTRRSPSGRRRRGRRAGAYHSTPRAPGSIDANTGWPTVVASPAPGAIRSCSGGSPSRQERRRRPAGAGRRRGRERPGLASRGWWPGAAPGRRPRAPAGGSGSSSTCRCPPALEPAVLRQDGAGGRAGRRLVEPQVGGPRDVGGAASEPPRPTKRQSAVSQLSQSVPAKRSRSAMYQADATAPRGAPSEARGPAGSAMTTSRSTTRGGSAMAAQKKPSALGE